MHRSMPFLAILGLLGGCAGQSQQSQQTVRAKPSGDPAEAVWHLRVGLNVAALMCKGRGRVSVASDYSRLLGRHRGLLASAHTAEQRRHGGGFERHQTRIYNRFANQRDPAVFCRKAAAVAKRAAVLDSPGLAHSAARLLGEID